MRVGEHALAIIRRGDVSNAETPSPSSAASSPSTPGGRRPPRRGGSTRRAGQQVAAAMATLPAETFPNTAAVAAELAAYGSDAHYELVLGALLEGL